MLTLEETEALRIKHEELESDLQEEESRPSPDEIKIAMIKREKLRIKDALAGHF